MLNYRLFKPTDINAVKRLADANRTELGFSPRQKFEEVALHNRGFVADIDQEVIGFVIFRHRKGDRQTTLSEICVTESHRRQHIGEGLIAKLISECIHLSRDYIQLKCPVDLPANQFYSRIGFTLHQTEPGKNRNLNIWRYAIMPQESDAT